MRVAFILAVVLLGSAGCARERSPSTTAPPSSSASHASVAGDAGLPGDAGDAGAEREEGSRVVVAARGAPGREPDWPFLGDVARPTGLRRVARAVVFISNIDWETKHRVFAPVVCAIDGAVLTGADCLRYVPARDVSLRVNEGPILRVVDRPTIAFTGGESSKECPRQRTLATEDPWSKHAGTPAIAVWPPDADLDLRIHARTPSAAIDARDRAIAGSDQEILQALRLDVDGDGRDDRILALAPPASDFGGPKGIAVELTSRASPTKTRFALEGFEETHVALVFASFDLLGDKKRDLLVFEPALNNFDLRVYQPAQRRVRFTLRCADG